MAHFVRLLADFFLGRFTFIGQCCLLLCFLKFRGGWFVVGVMDFLLGSLNVLFEQTFDVDNSRWKPRDKKLVVGTHRHGAFQQAPATPKIILNPKRLLTGIMCNNAPVCSGNAMFKDAKQMTFVACSTA